MLSVICNHGGGTARDVKFSEAIPFHCWSIDVSKFLNIKIPALAPRKSLRYQVGQYGG
ncbi:MAG: hypothetical protein ACI9LE_002038 [Paraglaciecola sp.]|jgi:hypothetical protein